MRGHASGARMRATSPTSTNSSSAAPALCSTATCSGSASLTLAMPRPTCAITRPPSSAPDAAQSGRAQQPQRQPQQVHEHDAGHHPVRELDRDARRAVEHAAFVVDADAAPQHEALRGNHAAATTGRRRSGSPCRRRAPRSWSWSSRRARSARASSARATTSRRRSSRASANADRHVGRVPRRPRQQRERQQAAEQMPHHDHRLEQPGDGPHAEQRLEDDRRQRERAPRARSRRSTSATPRTAAGLRRRRPAGPPAGTARACTSGWTRRRAAAAATTVAMPKRRRRTASNASTNTSTPSEPASMRCNCSRQALWTSTGRIAVAAWSTTCVLAVGHVARP